MRSWRRYVSSLETSNTSESPFPSDSTPSDASFDTQGLVPPGKTLFQRELIPIRPVSVNDISHPVAQAYARHTYEKQLFNPLGSAGRAIYKPHELLAYPPRPEDITLELLLASGAHLGHATQLWHPGNSQYIFGVRGTESGDPIHIISLDVTASHLRRACKVVESVAENGGVILFVGTRSGQSRVTVRAAGLAKGCHLFTKWVPGSITNGQQILGNCAKKVVDSSDHEMEGFDDQLDDYAAIKPDLVVCLNPVENYVLLRECGQHGIPTIGIIDTDCNPTWVTYPIPANDDSPRCVQVIAGALGRAGEAGHKTRLGLSEQGVVKYNARHRLKPPKSRAARRRVEGAAASHDYEVDVNDLGGVPVDQYERDQELFALLGGDLQAYNPTESEGVDLESEDAQDAAAEAFSLEGKEDISRIISEVQQSESKSQDASTSSKLSESQSPADTEVKLDIREEDYVQLQGRSGKHAEVQEKSAKTQEQSATDFLAPGAEFLQNASDEEFEAMLRGAKAKREAAKRVSSTAAPSTPTQDKANKHERQSSASLAPSADEPKEAAAAAPVASPSPEKRSPTIAATPAPPSSPSPSSAPEEKQETSAQAAEEPQPQPAAADAETATMEPSPAEISSTKTAAGSKPAEQDALLLEAKEKSEFVGKRLQAQKAQDGVQFAFDQATEVQEATVEEQAPIEKDVPSQPASESVKAEESVSTKVETPAAAQEVVPSQAEPKQSVEGTPGAKQEEKK
jgi:ribosomal protein S2